MCFNSPDTYTNQTLQREIAGETCPKLEFIPLIQIGTVEYLSSPYSKSIPLVLLESFLSGNMGETLQD